MLNLIQIKNHQVNNKKKIKKIVKIVKNDRKKDFYIGK